MPKVKRNFFTNYFKKAEKYHTLRFIVEITLVAFLLKILSIIFFDTILALFNVHLTTNLSFEKSQVQEGLIWIAISVPLFAAFETLTSQMFITWLVSRFTQNFWPKFVIATIVFTLLHVDPSLMVAIWPVGALLTWTYLIKRKKGRWEAFWVTTAIHSIHNYLALLLVWLTIH